MTITKKVTKIESIDVDLSKPKFYKQDNEMFRVSNESIIHLTGYSILTREAERLTYSYFVDSVAEAMSGEEITEGEFNSALFEKLEKINELAGISIAPTLQLQD